MQANAAHRLASVALVNSPNIAVPRFRDGSDAPTTPRERPTGASASVLLSGKAAHGALRSVFHWEGICLDY